MNTTSDIWPLSILYPVRIFALLLIVVFAVEGIIMIALPLFPAWSESPIMEGLLDASLLTLVMTPVLWWLVVRPMHGLFEVRGHLLHRVFHAQEQERARIARDLHDEIGQHLTALLVGLKTIDAASDLPAAKERAGQLRDLAALAHSETRRLAQGLRPGVLDELRLVAAIERLCEEFQAAHNISMRLEIAPRVCDRLTSDCETALYRIVQEALTNAARHSGCTGIEVSLNCHKNTIVLRISDNGRGWRPNDSEGPAKAGKIGLASIHERALMLGGRCTVRSEPQRGTCVQVSVPKSEKCDGKNASHDRG